MESTSGKTSRFLDGLIDLALPPLCTACGDYTESVTSLCNSCVSRIDRYDYPICLQCEQPIFSGFKCPQCEGDPPVLFAFGNYTDPLKEAVHQFKFKGVTRVAGYFADELAFRFGDLIAEFRPAMLVPIPLHPSREHARGFNQATIFADKLGQRLTIDVSADLLVCIKKGRPHSRLSDAARARNIKGAFAATTTRENDLTVFIVDDVVTGGHTVREARAELLQAGLQVPAVISIAHGR